MVPALARASVLSREGSKASKARLEFAANAAGSAFHLCPSLEVLVPALLEEGVDGLQARCTLTPGMSSRCAISLACIQLQIEMTRVKSIPWINTLYAHMHRGHCHGSVQDQV